MRTDTQKRASNYISRIFSTTGELACPMLAALTEANDTAQAKRFRKLCAVHQRQRETEALELQQKEAAQ
jgi:hypothetical protein